MKITRETEGMTTHGYRNYKFNGDIITDESIEFVGFDSCLLNIEVDGKIKCENLNCQANLHIGGGINCNSMKVAYNCAVEGSVNAKNGIEIGGRFNIDYSVKAGFIEANGDIVVGENITTEYHLESEGTISAAYDINAGANIFSKHDIMSGGIIKGDDIKSGGNIKCDSIFSEEDIVAEYKIEADSKIKASCWLKAGVSIDAGDSIEANIISAPLHIEAGLNKFYGYHNVDDTIKAESILGNVIFGKKVRV